MILVTKRLRVEDWDSWVGKQTRVTSTYTASWGSTVEMLKREIEYLQEPGMPDPVLLMDIAATDLRMDGQIKANARPANTNAVALSFESVKAGPLTLTCDRFESVSFRNRMLLWQHNLRSIALTLHALRSVDRYGVDSTGKQYAGWRQNEEDPYA